MPRETELVTKLTNNHYTIATAESCTGGLVAATLVSVSGASDVLDCSFVTYANEAKMKYAHVSKETLLSHGALSSETAAEMAEGCAIEAGASVGISTTGIAGPTGGTKEKPVGLVYIGCFVCGKTTVICCHFSGDRQQVRRQAVEKAIDLAIHCLET